jgi:glycosyltransferase involved in cell wall biosynthesis
MSISNPEVSIVMAVYNGELFLKNSIRSILNQSFPNFELIIIDDGSKDNSFQIAKDFQAVDSRVIAFSLEHGGVSKTANYGITQCRGKYIARMDADDWSYPNRLELQFNFMELNKDIVASSGRAIYIDEDNFPIHINNPHLHHDDILKELCKGRGGALVNSAVIMRRDAITKIGGYNINYRCSEDLELFLRLSEIGKLSNINNIILKVIRHKSSLTALQNSWKAQSRDQEIVDNYYKRRGLYKNPVKQYGVVQIRSIGEYYAYIASQAFEADNFITGYRYTIKAIMNFRIYRPIIKSLLFAFVSIAKLKIRNKIAI